MLAHGELDLPPLIGLQGNGRDVGVTVDRA